jgi:hypothetical protein
LDKNKNKVHETTHDTKRLIECLDVVLSLVAHIFLDKLKLEHRITLSCR